MRTTKWHFGIIISAILIVLNIFLLYSNVDRQNQINLLQSGFSLTDRTGQILNAAVISHPEVVIPASGISLLVFFPETSCPACLEYEVPALNSIYQEYAPLVHIYAIGHVKTLLNRYGAEFPTTQINTSDSVFDDDLHFTNPFTVLTDPEGNLHTFYLSEVGNPQKSDRFWQRMEVFFKAITKEAPPVPMETDLQ